VSDGRTAAVVHATELPMEPTPDGTGTYRQPIDERIGCRMLVQRVLRYRPGRSETARHGDSETVVYVVEGRGRLFVEDEPVELEPGTAAYVPPGASHAFDAADGEHLLLVTVLAPPPVAAQNAGSVPPPAAPPITTTVDEQEPLPAGDDRFFKLLIDPRFGCRNVTQFVGFIERSRAPFHTHTYEEVLYILGGAGVVHVDGREEPIFRGSSVFLPPGVPHCLENRSDGVLRLLGVFSPAGSPADKREG
jgi:mannose-6-phosphate isomerase-like protein (cupin superfamily)